MPEVISDKNKWGDDTENDATSPAPHISYEADGTKVVVEYRINEDGKRVKVTRRTRTRVIKSIANHDVAERKKIVKYGDAAGNPPGPDSNSTSFGEKVVLKMGVITNIEEQAAPEKSLKDSLKQSKILCRICKGDHWTSKCPFKDTHQPLDEIASELKEVALTSSSSDNVASKPGKYVPPSLRNRKEGEAPPVGSSMRDRRDEFPTIRITNLSEDVNEHDVKELVSRFGTTSRVFVARDHVTQTCKGFAFVSFYRKEEALAAVEALNGYGYDNLILRVEWAKSNKD